MFWRSRGRAGMGRATLQSLLETDARLLSDLGLTRHDVAQAMRDRSSAGEFLSARRHARAAEWLR